MIFLETRIVLLVILFLFSMQLQASADTSNLVTLSDKQQVKTIPLDTISISKILFTLKVGKENHIAIMNLNGTALTDIASCGEGECYPNWSPDGKKIVFERHNEKGSGIYLMDSDGSNQIRLSPIPGFDVRPSFSPNGRIYYLAMFIAHKIMKSQQRI